MLIWADKGPLHIGRGKFIYKGEEVPLGLLTPTAIESLKKKGKLIEKFEEKETIEVPVIPAPENKVEEAPEVEEKEEPIKEEPKPKPKDTKGSKVIKRSPIGKKVTK